MLGGMIGALVGLVVAELSFIAESSGLMLLAFIVAGMLLSLTRWRKVVWAAGVIVTIGLLIVSVHARGAVVGVTAFTGRFT